MFGSTIGTRETLERWPNLRIALCQFGASPSISDNIRTISEFAERAKSQGADLLVCPEAAMSRFPAEQQDQVPAAEPLDGSFGTALASATADSSLTIVAGGFTPGDGTRVKNTLFVAADGRISAHYDKIHLYDAFEARESNKVIAGDIQPTVIDVDGITVGLATCYDLRFPELFRVLADMGSKVVVLPAAWIKGAYKEEHWLTLLRARAIENSLFVVGSGESGERSIGRSAIFDPMGLQLTDLGIKASLAIVDIDVADVDRTREINPGLNNRRFCIVSTTPGA